MTSLSYDLDPTDAAVLDVLNGITNLDVHDGRVADSDDSAMTVSAPVPYVLFSSSLNFATSQRVGGWASRVTPFTTTCVHGSRAGAKAVAVAVRDHLDGRAITVDGKPRRIRLDDPTDPVTVNFDEQWSRPNGGALFYALDRWVVVG